MTEAEFRAKRRQQFLTEKYFKLNEEFLAYLTNGAIEAMAERGDDLDPFREGGVFKKKLSLLRLRYTAGEPIESLQSLYAEALHWFEEWHKADALHVIEIGRKRNEDLRTDGSPCYFEDLFHFQLALDMVSVGLLLGKADAVRRIAQLVGFYRHTDMLFEALIESVVPDPDKSVEIFHHEQPYGLLLDAIFTGKTPDARADFVKQYLAGWYKAFDGVPWHDGHSVQTEEYSNYHGYWAFDAAAVSVLFDIDDSSYRDHLVYPKDFADWARANGSLQKLLHSTPVGDAKPETRQQGIPAGETCPKSGWWSTPAKLNSRRYFKQGDVMPNIDGSDYGNTLWQWNVNQDTPTLSG
jgi:hypothetical protein